MNHPNIVVKSKKLENCIYDGIQIHYKNTNKHTEIKLLGNKKGKSGTPYKITFDQEVYVTKETKIDTDSLTKKGKPFVRIYKGTLPLVLNPPNGKFHVHILSNYETQTLNNLNMMYVSNNYTIRDNILQMYDAFMCKKTGFNLLEIANKGTLHDLLGGEITLKQFASVFIQMYRALYHLQDTIDFCHNDFKSKNIFLSDRGNGIIVKMADLDRSTSTFIYQSKYYRITNRKDLCFGSKDYIYKIYDGVYFQIGTHMDAVCRLRHTIHNIAFCQDI